MKTKELQLRVLRLEQLLAAHISREHIDIDRISEADVEKLRGTWGLNYGYCKYCRRGPDTDESDEWEDANES